jgi:hypothetical protein
MSQTRAISRGSSAGDGASPHRGGGSRRPSLVALAAVLAAAALAGCSDDACEPYCANPVDRVLVPRMRAAGLEPRKVDPFEHCRRIAIDLLGRGPGGSEIEACVAASPARRVELAQDSDDYIAASRRVWSEVLGYDIIEVWSRDVADLDALVAELAAGDLDYEAFATRAVTHPGFIGLHGYDEWAAWIYRVFLGRPARTDEIAALRPLSVMWQERYLCEGAIWWNLYQLYLEETTPAEALAYADLDCADTAKANVGWNPCLCQPDDGLVGCVTDALGTSIAIGAACANAGNPYAEANILRIGPSAPGEDDTCPDGSRDPNCRDRAVDEDFMTMSPIQPWRVIDDGGRSELDQIGAALAARPDFWEAAVDRELRRLTGWWQTSFRHPDSDLPEVRAALADRLRDGASLRDVQRWIMTSQLYAAPAATHPGWRGPDEPPPWASGPTKLLAAEAWVDTVMRAVGEEPGSCDVRNLTVYGYEYELGDASRLEEPYSSLDGDIEDFYIEAATSLGGCTAGRVRPRQSNVGLAFAQGETARLICAYGDEAAPRDWSGDLDDAANHLVRRLYARRPVDGEVAELVGDMEACLEAGACADDDAAVRWLCQRLADSTELSTY